MFAKPNTLLIGQDKLPIMQHFKSHPEFYNRPIRIINEDPQEVIETFYSAHSLSEIRQRLWNMVEVCFTTDKDIFEDGVWTVERVGVHLSDVWHDFYIFISTSLYKNGSNNQYPKSERQYQTINFVASYKTGYSHILNSKKF